MKSIKLLFFILFFTFLNSICFSQNIALNKKTAQSIEELQMQLENVLKDMHVPGLSLAIVHRDGFKWAAGLGKADLANDRSANETTLFRIGSISKGFISLSILKLANEGKLSLDDPVQKLAPEVWFSNKWEASSPVRLVHLLENTTGWDDMHFRELAKDPTGMSFLDTLDYDHSSRISRWPPGTRMAYSNSGPAVAAYIVEKISGKSFEEYVEQNFFKPIGMQTATYFQPISELTTTLYQSDGKTPLPYWNLLYRSVGSINANAIDMANYLLFYLNRGNIHNRQILPTASFDRMETPTSNWAAKEGLQVGYGLSNYGTIFDGFVYHGHDGNLPGGLSALAYLANEGVGYFYSLNSSNREAFKEVGALIRAYITQHLQKPPTPPVVPIPETTKAYSGWYEPNSPRMELFFFIERLIGMSYVHFDENKLLINSLKKKNATFLPVTDTEFRYVPRSEFQDTVPTLKLLTPNAEGEFIQLNWGLRNPSIDVTLKRLPTWIAMFEIVITAFVLLAFISFLVYAPFWIFRGLNNKELYPVERSILFWPLVDVLSLLCIIVICILCNIDTVILRLGNLTVWSFSLFLATIVFAVGSIASIIVLWRAPKNEVRSIIRIYSIIIIIALLVSTAYLAYWGIIGLRTWT